MFMAFEHLNLPPHLVPWQQHGMDYVLSKKALAPELSLLTAQAKPVQVNSAQARSMQNTQAQNGQTQSGQAQARTSHTKFDSPNIKAQNKQTTNDTNENASLTPTSTPFVAAEYWPSPWQVLLQKTPPAPVIWTYFSLGDDLSGNPNADRRDFMRKLLTDLGHRKGTHSFWPIALPDQNTEQSVAHAQAFWSGVQILKAKAVIAMGQAATKAMGLEQNIRPFMHTRYNGCFVVVLRDVDFLIAEPHSYNNVREFLRRSLASFGR